MKSSDNIADLGTRRRAVIEDISEDSTWQLGPEWLKLNEEKWPISQDICGVPVPVEEILQSNVVAVVALKVKGIISWSRLWLLLGKYSKENLLRLAK